MSYTLRTCPRVVANILPKCPINSVLFIMNALEDLPKVDIGGVQHARVFEFLSMLCS